RVPSGVPQSATGVCDGEAFLHDQAFDFLRPADVVGLSVRREGSSSRTPPTGRGRGGIQFCSVPFSGKFPEFPGTSRKFRELRLRAFVQPALVEVEVDDFVKPSTVDVV